MTDGCLLNTVFFVSKQRCAWQKRIKLKDSILTYDGLRDSVFMSPLNHSFSETSRLLLSLFIVPPGLMKTT